MISELENVLKATVVISPEFESNARKVVVKEANIKPNDKGIVPLGKDGAFEKNEEEVLDFIGPSTAGPLQEPKPSDTIEEAPVLTEDPSSLEDVVTPIKEGIDALQNKIESLKEEPAEEKKEDELVSPLGVTMPEIETPIANEPNLNDTSLFSIPGETPEPASAPEPEPEPKEEKVEIELPEMPSLDADIKEEPSLEEMLSPSSDGPKETNIPEMSKGELPEIDSPKSEGTNSDLDAALEDRLLSFENNIKSNLENQIDTLLGDLRKMVGDKSYTPSEPKLETMSNTPVMESTPEPSPMPIQQEMSPMMQPQSQIPMMTPMMGPMMQPQQQMPVQNPMMSSNMYNNPEPQSIDNGPIQGGGMFIQF